MLSGRVNNDASGFLFNGDCPSLDPHTFSLANASAAIGDVSLDFLLDTLEEKGVVRTLAEPNLITLSGDRARFLTGGEFPIPVGRTLFHQAIEASPDFFPEARSSLAALDDLS